MSQFKYINEDILIKGNILEFRNGKRDKRMVERALSMCKMKIKEKKDTFYILEAKNG